MSKLIDAAKVFLISLPIVPVAALAVSGEKLQKSRYNPLIAYGSLIQNFTDSVSNRIDLVWGNSSLSDRTSERVAKLGVIVGVGVPALALSAWVTNISPVTNGEDVLKLRGDCDQAEIVQRVGGGRELKVPEGCQIYR